MGGKRSYSAGRFALGIDGAFAGFIKKVAGGDVKGEVVKHNLGTSFYAKKHLATISHDAITVDIAAGMGASMWEWVKASMDQGFIQKNLELQACNFNHEVESVRAYSDCYITEVGLPALDGASKDAVYVNCKIEPRIIRYEKGTGDKIKGDENAKSKDFLCSNFKVELGGLPCERVAKVGALKWTQKIVKDEVGAFREAMKEPAALEVSDLELDISMADIDAWQDWHKSFVIDGMCSDGDELSGSITLLGPDMKTELLVVELLHVGIMSLAAADVEANKEEVARFKVKCYVEEMHIKSYNA